MKRLTPGIFTAVFALLTAGPAFAHPLDISISEFNILPNANKIEVSTYLHPFEGDYLLTNKLGFTLTKITDFFQHNKIFFDYVKQNSSFKNNGVDCVFKAGDMPPKDEIEIVADGIQINYAWICPASLDKLSFTNAFFIEDFPLQTNKMVFYLKGNYDKPIYEKILTTKVFSDGFNLNSPPDKDAAKLIDMDGDGLSDYEEALYLTDPTIKDTDGDGYTDKEEVDNGWDARDPNPSLGQVALTIAAAPTSTETVIEVLPATTTPMLTTGPQKPSGAFFFQNERLKKILQTIKMMLDSGGLAGKLLVFFPVLLLGFLHSVESGHGKSVLMSYLVETDRTMFDALKFCLTLALTDIAGVTILGAGFELLSLSGNAYQYMGTFQTFGMWGLLGLGVFLLGRNLLRHVQPWRKMHESGHHHPVALGFLAGLVPCASGWALILTVISLNQVRWMVPIILVFGLGIFSFLIVLSFGILKFRNALTKRAAWIVEYSPIASSILLITIASVALKMAYFG